MASDRLTTVFRVINRLLLFTVLVMVSVDTKAACDGMRLKLLFAPTFGPGFMREFFSDVTDTLKAQGCFVSTSHVDSFQDLFQKISTKKHDVLVIPSLFNEELKAFGYARKLSGFDGIQGYVVARRDGKVIRIRDLVGKTLNLNDPLSMGASEWMRITKEKGIYKQVKVEYGGKLDSLLFKLMNGEIDSTHTIDLLYNRLPAEYKEKLLIIHRDTLRAPASILFTNRLPKKLVKTLTDNIEKNTKHWKKFPEPKYEMDKEFLTRLRKSLYSDGR